MSQSDSAFPLNSGGQQKAVLVIFIHFIQGFFQENLLCTSQYTQHKTMQYASVRLILLWGFDMKLIKFNDKEF